MKNNPHNITVGQKLYIVYSKTVGRGGAEFMEVLKVGNKWASVGIKEREYAKERVDLETLVLDGGQYSSPGRAYLSQEDHQTETLLKAAWGKLVESLSYSAPPKELTIEKLTQVKALLGAPYNKL